MILELLLIFVGGLTSAGHCLGMCGGFVLTLGANVPSLTANLLRQLVYAVGRVSVYTMAGAAVGYTGWRLGGGLQSLINTQAVLCIAAGVLLIGQGLITAGVVSWFRSSPTSCPGASVFSALLRAPRLGSVFVAGACNALLPCGLVYAYLALAAATADMLHAALVMALFGLGTVFPLLITGLLGGVLSARGRRSILRVAAWCMVLTGGLTLTRGILFLAFTPAGDNCPYCIRIE